MGNYRFRLSDMIPNAWFYKLKDMGKLRNQNISTHSMKKKHQHTHTSSSSSSSAAASAALSSKSKQTPLSHQRKSYYFTRDLTPAAPSHDTFYDNVATNARTSDSHCSAPPRKSSKKKRSTRRNRPSPSPRLVSSSVTAGCSCRATLESVWTKPDSTPEEYPNSPLETSSENESVLPRFDSNSGIATETFDGMLSWSASCRCRVDNDIIIDMENKDVNAKFDNSDKLNGFNTVSELDLPPIITNPSKFRSKTEDSNERETHNEPTKFRSRTAEFEERNACGSLSVKVVKEAILSTSSKEQQKISPARRFSANSPAGLKLRTNSPRIANRRIQGRKSASSSSSSSRRSVSDSFAVVKSSKDPQRDFRESMVEMIVENNLCASKDLEDLLACYLSLNSDEYHDLIIRVFKQIWFDIVDIRPKVISSLKIT